MSEEQLREQTIDHRLLMPEPKTQQGTQTSNKNNGEKHGHADGAAEEISWRSSNQEADNRVRLSTNSPSEYSFSAISWITLGSYLISPLSVELEIILYLR